MIKSRFLNYRAICITSGSGQGKQKNDITTKWFICLPHFSAQKRVRIPSVIRGIFRSKMAPIGEKDERMGSTLADDDENESQTLWYLLRSIVLLIDICKISSSLLSPALYFWNSGVASHLQLIIIYRGKIIVFISNKLIVYFLRIDIKVVYFTLWHNTD